MTLWFGEAWKRVCEVFPFEEVFTKMGCGLTATGKGDELIRLQGLDDRPFTFDQNDRFRHVKTGLLPDIIPEVLMLPSAEVHIETMELMQWNRRIQNVKTQTTSLSGMRGMRQVVRIV